MTRIAHVLLAIAAESLEILGAIRDGWRDGLRKVERPEWLR